MRSEIPGWLAKAGHVFQLQLVIVLYTCASLTAKVAASFPWTSLEFLFYYGIDLLLMVIYALLWRQMLRRIGAFTAMANRGTAVLWSMIWASVVFQENVSPQNIFGVLVIFAGVMLINTEKTGAGGGA